MELYAAKENEVCSFCDICVKVSQYHAGSKILIHISRMLQYVLSIHPKVSPVSKIANLLLVWHPS